MICLSAVDRGRCSRLVRIASNDHDANPGLVKTTPMPGRPAVVLFVLWMAGLVTSYTFGGSIHLLFLVAILAIVFELTKDRRAS